MREPRVSEVLDGYVFQWGEPDYVEVVISDVRRKSDEWRGEVVIKTKPPGIPPSHITETTHTLSATQSRTQLARTLDDSYRLANGSRWSDYLEMACVLTVRKEREGKPFTSVGALDTSTAPPLWLIDRSDRPGGYIRLHHPASLWADGGSGKSTLAVLFGMSIVTGLELAGFTPQFMGPVIWLDWESDDWDIDDTIKCIRTGMGVEETVEFDYRREVWPFAQSFKQVARQVETRKAALVIFDSVGYAIGGDGEKAGEVLEFVRAVRAMGTSTLLIDHVRKGDTGGKAFGSAYKFNEVRLGFELTTTQEEGSPESIVAVKCRKANKGGKPPKLWLRTIFGEGSIRYETMREDEVPQEAISEQGSVRERIRRTLREASGLMNADEIAEAAGVKDKIAQVKARLSEMAEYGEVYVAQAKGSARRYGLKSGRDEGMGG